MLSPELKNPFVANKLDDTVKLPPGDVPDLHASVLARCGEVFAEARQTEQGVGLLVIGEAGSGKSHLIAQLRRWTAERPDIVLVAVPLRGAYAGGLWRHLRERLVTELLVGYANHQHGANGLLRVLRNRFPKWATAAQGASGGLLDWLVGRSRPGADLSVHLDEFAGAYEFDYGLQRVLPKVGITNLTSLAHAWLRGKQLGSEDLVKLGLPPAHPSEQEQEKNAREVVLSLLRLAGDRTVLALCFDEVEAIQAGTWDAAVLRQFATLATDLLAQPGPRAVITFVRPTLQLDLQRAIERSNWQKVFPDQTAIPPLTWEQTIQIVRSRLDAEPTCQAARRLRSGEPDWPLGRRFLEEQFRQHHLNLTPRHLIMACRLEFDRLLKGKRPERSPDTASDVPGVAQPPAQGPGPKPEVRHPGESSPTRIEEFLRVWGRLREKLLVKLQGLQFDTMMAIGLPWLARLTGLPCVRVEDHDDRLGDVNLLFQPLGRGRKPLGVTFCNHQPRTLWRRLDRVLSQWDTARGKYLGGLVVLRSGVEQTTDASQRRLDALRRAGAQVVIVERQQLAELAAFQEMLTASLGGDLTRHGQPVETKEYDAWARDNLSEAVKELLHVVFEPFQTPASEGAAAGKRVEAAVAAK